MRQPTPSRVDAAPTRSWPRRRRRAWSRRSHLPGSVSLLAVIPSLPRAELARLTERMIDRMDELDGDPDLEDLREDDEDTHDLEETYDA